MAELKTKPTNQSVEEFLGRIRDDATRRDCFSILKIMKQALKAEPKMWGGSIVGLGSCRYKYESGREGEWFLCGFSPRKQNLTLYIMPGLERYQTLLKKLGRHSTGKCCLYIKRLSDVDIEVLTELIQKSVKDARGLSRS